MLELPSDKPRHSNCLTTKLGTHAFAAKPGTADKPRICRTPPFPTKSAEYRSKSSAYSVFFNTPLILILSVNVSVLRVGLEYKLYYSEYWSPMLH